MLLSNCQPSSRRESLNSKPRGFLAPLKAKWRDFGLLLCLFIVASWGFRAGLSVSREHDHFRGSSRASRAGSRARKRSLSDANKADNNSETTSLRHRAIEPPKDVPSDFVWHTYLKFHPDLLEAGINSERAARNHFKEHGRLEGRPYKLPRVFMQYTACTSFVEQVYSHFNAMVISSKLGPAELVMAPSVGVDAQGFVAYDTDTIYDVSKISKHWLRSFDIKMKIRKTTVLDLSDGFAVAPDRTLPVFREPDVLDESLVEVDQIYDRLLTVRRLTDVLFWKIGLKMMAAGAGFDPSFPVLVQLPCTFRALRTDSCYQTLESKAVPSLEWNPYVTKLVAKIRAKLHPYDGVALLNSSDVAAFTSEQGKDVLEQYLPHMRSVLKGGRCFVMAESTHLSVREVAHMAGLMAKEGLCSEVKRKEDYASAKELQGLTSEQRILLDMLLLMEADQVVGSYHSLLTLFVREYRFIRKKMPRYTVSRVNVTGVDHWYTPNQLFYGGMLAETDRPDKVGVDLLPLSSQRL